MSKFIEIPPQEILHVFLNYDKETGILYWRKRNIESFNGEEKLRIGNSWNTRFAGKEAFGLMNHEGRKGGPFNGKVYNASRIVWVYVHGNQPTGEIDHINGNVKDNRIENLRDVSHAINGKNCKLYKNSPSGVAGVRWVPGLKKWAAAATVDKIYYRLGLYREKLTAQIVVENFRLKNGFTERHGQRKES